MKKLIALAVAAAVTAPAMAAVSISGAMEVVYSSENKTMNTEDADLNVAASTELNNGMTLSGGFGIDGGVEDGSGSMTLSGAFCTLGLGDVAGAIDANDGSPAGTARFDGGLSIGAADAGISYTLPTLVEGLGVSVAFAPENGDVESDIASDVTGLAVSYSIMGVSLVYATEDRGAAADADMYGVSYAANGFAIGYKAGEIDGGNESSAVAASYTTGDITVAYNQYDVDTTAGAAVSDTTSMSISYNLGGGASVYAATTEEDVANTEDTAVGIKFAF